MNPENKTILSIGYNGLPRNVEDDPEILNNKELKLANIIHGELNAILNASYNGISIKGAYLYVWGLPPCSSCTSAIIQSGIEKVYFVNTNNKKTSFWHTEFSEKSVPKLNSAKVQYTEFELCPQTGLLI